MAVLFRPQRELTSFFHFPISSSFSPYALASLINTKSVQIQTLSVLHKNLDLSSEVSALCTILCICPALLVLHIFLECFDLLYISKSWLRLVSSPPAASWCLKVQLALLCIQAFHVSCNSPLSWFIFSPPCAFLFVFGFYASFLPPLVHTGCASFLYPPPPTLGQHWLLKQFSLNHPVEYIQKPKLANLYVRVKTSSSYFIVHNQFVK